MELPYVGPKMREGGIEEKRLKEDVRKALEANRPLGGHITVEEEEEVKRQWDELERKETEDDKAAKAKNMRARRRKKEAARKRKGKGKKDTMKD